MSALVCVCMCDMHVLGYDLAVNTRRLLSGQVHKGRRSVQALLSHDSLPSSLPGFPAAAAAGMGDTVRALLAEADHCFQTVCCVFFSFSSSTDCTARGLPDLTVGRFVCLLLVFMLTQSQSRCGKG